MDHAVEVNVLQTAGGLADDLAGVGRRQMALLVH